MPTPWSGLWDTLVAEPPRVLVDPEWEVFIQVLQCVGDGGALGPPPDSQSPHHPALLLQEALCKGSLGISAFQGST